MHFIWAWPKSLLYEVVEDTQENNVFKKKRKTLTFSEVMKLAVGIGATEISSRHLQQKL